MTKIKEMLEDVIKEIEINREENAHDLFNALDVQISLLRRKIFSQEKIQKPIGDIVHDAVDQLAKILAVITNEETFMMSIHEQDVDRWASKTLNLKFVGKRGRYVVYKGLNGTTPEDVARLSGRMTRPMGVVYLQPNQDPDAKILLADEPSIRLTVNADDWEQVVLGRSLLKDKPGLWTEITPTPVETKLVLVDTNNPSHVIWEER